MASVAIASGVMNLLGSIINSGTSLANTIMNKDANEAAAKASEIRAMQELETAKRNNVIILIIVIAIVLIIGTIVIKKS